MPIKIEDKIVGYEVVTDKEKSEPEVPDLVIYDRPDKVDGRTYKIRPPSSKSAMYITINNITLDDGTIRPFEIFINTKNVDDQAWITAFTRMLSSVFRTSGDLDFVPDELAQVYDPNGGYWHDQKLMPSLVAHIGSVIEKHFEWMGKVNDNVSRT